MSKDTKTMRCLKVMYDGLRLNQEDIFHKAKLVLSVYRDVVWASIQRADDIRENAAGIYGQDLSVALTYLSDFAPTEDKDNFEMKLSFLFETKWMVDLIDNALAKVYKYHNNGKLYFDILSKCYLTAYRYSETDILESIDVSRTTYYALRKEAILLLGIALWGYAIPQLQGVYDESASADLHIPSFFKCGQKSD